MGFGRAPRQILLVISLGLAVLGAAGTATVSSSGAVVAVSTAGDSQTTAARVEKIAEMTTTTTTTASVRTFPVTATTAAPVVRFSPPTTLAVECYGVGTYDGRGGCAYPGFLISGRIVDAVGSPIEFGCAAVEWPPSSRIGPIFPRAASDADGRFHVLVDPTDTAAQVRIGDCDQTAPRWVARLVEVRMAPGGTSDVEVSLERSSTVVGRAVDQDGAPVAGLCVRSESAWGLGMVKAVSGEDGRLRLVGIVPGSVGLDGSGAACENARRVASIDWIEVGSGEIADIGDVLTYPRLSHDVCVVVPVEGGYSCR